jgi:serine/threonine protein kinase
MVIGDSIGPYRILAKQGEGGVGEVYRARDTTLDRDVAIKILSQGVAADPERVARFQREAKTLAALNHPHIAQVYGFERSESVSALVMELVASEDLAARLARGPLPIHEAVTVARQIADGLEAAHGQGIIHRDLKPANIKRQDDGSIKVLDFGLAKAAEWASEAGQAGRAGQSALLSSPTIASPAMTQAGMNRASRAGSTMANLCRRGCSACLPVQRGGAGTPASQF